MSVHNILDNITAIKLHSDKFYLANKIVIRQHKLFLRAVKITFPYATVGYVTVQIRLNGHVLLPDTSMIDTNKMLKDGLNVSNGIIATDLPVVFPVYRDLNKGDKLETWYKNSHEQTDLAFYVTYEVCIEGEDFIKEEIEIMLSSVRQLLRRGMPV